MAAGGGQLARSAQPGRHMMAAAMARGTAALRSAKTGGHDDVGQVLGGEGAAAGLEAMQTVAGDRAQSRCEAVGVLGHDLSPFGLVMGAPVSAGCAVNRRGGGVNPVEAGGTAGSGFAARERQRAGLGRKCRWSRTGAAEPSRRRGDAENGRARRAWVETDGAPSVRLGGQLNG